MTSSMQSSNITLFKSLLLSDWSDLTPLSVKVEG